MADYLLAGTIEASGTAEQTENLISDWRHNNGSGSTVSDTETNNPLALSGSTEWWVNSYYRFASVYVVFFNRTGSNGYEYITDANCVNIPGKSDASGPSSFTVGVWFRIAESVVLAETYPLINKMGQKSTGNYGGWSLTAQNVGGRYPTFTVRKDDTTGTTITSNTEASAWAWHQLIAQYKYVADGTSEMKLWLNNSQVASTTSAVGPIQNNPQPLELARYKDTETSTEIYYGGTLSGVHLYDFYLSSSQISELYNSTLNDEQENVTLADPVSNPGEALPTSVHDDILGVSQFAGSKIFVYWAAIETAQGTYSFTALDEQIDYLDTNGKKAQIVVLTEGEFVVPAYLTGGGFGTGALTSPTNSNYKIPIYWNSSVMGRIIALINALATQYDSDATVESIGTWRTYLDISDADLTSESYSASSYITQLESLASSCKPNLPNTELMIGADYIKDASESQLNTFASNVASSNAGFCDPYLVPTANLGQSSPVMKAAKATSATLGADITTEAFGGSLGHFSPEEMVVYGTTQLGLDYFNWTNAPAKRSSRYRFDVAVIPAVS